MAEHTLNLQQMKPVMVIVVILLYLFPKEGLSVPAFVVSRAHWKMILVISLVILFCYTLQKKKIYPFIYFSHTLKMTAMQVKNYGEHRMEIGLLPRPKVVHKNDVLIKVYAASINPIDFRLKEGYGIQLLDKRRKSQGLPYRGEELPLIVGRDCSGVVVDVGPSVTNIKVGDEVWAAVGVTHTPGTLAEYVLVKDNSVSRKPKNMDHKEAASLPYVITTTWQALVETAGLRYPNTRGKRVLVLAGTGGVGSFAIQLLKAWGCHVTTTCSSSGIEMVKSLGADDVIDYKEDDLQTQMAEKPKFDVVFCTRGSDAYQTCLDVCKPSGFVVTIVTPVIKNLDNFGTVLGTLKTMFDYATTAWAQKLKHNKTFAYAFHTPNGIALDTVAQLVEEGKIKACVDKTYKLIEANEAIDYLKAGHARGKTVILLPIVEEEQSNNSS